MIGIHRQRRALRLAMSLPFPEHTASFWRVRVHCTNFPLKGMIITFSPLFRNIALRGFGLSPAHIRTEYSANHRFRIKA